MPPSTPWSVLGVPIDSVSAPVDGDPFGTELAPAALRAHGLVDRLAVTRTGSRPFVLGLCCALVMGAVAGARDALGRIGLANVDGHLDLYDHRTSPTGEAAALPDRLGIAVYPPEAIVSDPAGLGQQIADQLGDRGRRFWVHLDLDVLNEVVFPGTDYLMPGGLDVDQLTQLLQPLGRSPGLVGVSVGSYNPTKDPDGRCGSALADLLVAAFGPRP